LLIVYAEYADWKELKLREGKKSSADMPPPSLRLRIGGGLSEMSRQKGILLISAKLRLKTLCIDWNHKACTCYTRYWEGQVGVNYHIIRKGYVRQDFGKYFKLLSFMEKVVFGFQDVAFLEKK
jgi:hypothetical protein